MQRKFIPVVLAISAGIVAIVFYLFRLMATHDTLTTPVDRLVVEKSKRQLLAYADGQLIKTYTIALGRNPVGHKQVEGDNKTPEGIYFIDGKNPNSKFYKNLGVSYPNDQDRAVADQLGKSPGGAIKIHGLPNGWTGEFGTLYHPTDWTAGCIALTNDEIDELYRHVAVGTPIEIRP